MQASAMRATMRDMPMREGRVIPLAGGHNGEVRRRSAQQGDAEIIDDGPVNDACGRDRSAIEDGAEWARSGRRISHVGRKITTVRAAPAPTAARARRASATAARPVAAMDAVTLHG